MIAPLSTKLLLKALSSYEKLGYEVHDVPLIIDKDVCDFTKPIGAKNFEHHDKDYIASAEQSFLQLIKDKEIKNGKYQALTPCIRNEPVLDGLHYLIFHKLELIEIGSTDFMRIVIEAQQVMLSLGVETHLEKTDLGVDIMDHNEVELGSYGTRCYLGVNYIYGTGIAEPRFSMSLKANSK